MRSEYRNRRLALAGLILSSAGLAAQAPALRQPYAPAAPPAAVPANPSAPSETARPATYPIDLATALRLTDANNPTVGVARARVKEAIAQLDRARVAWVPNLSFGPNFFYHDGIDQNRRGELFTVARGFYSLGAGPTIRVDLSDALYLPLVARQGVRAANARASAAINNTQLDVAIAYLDLVELHALRAINADILARTEQVLRSAQVGEKANANKTAADVNRAATEVNLRREEGIVLRGRAAAAAARLAQLLALDPSVELVPYEVAVVPLILVPGETTLEQLIQMSLRGRPEIAAAQAQVAAADTLVRQSKAAPFLPRLQGEFIGGGMSGGRNDDFSPLQSQYNAGVALVWNLEAFGLGNAASIRGRQAGLEAELYRLREVETIVSSQVVEAAQLAAARFAALTAAQEAVKQAQEMYRKFRDASFGMVGPKGQFDALETLTAVQALNQARVQYLQQIVEFNRAQFRLYAAVGQPPLCALDTSVVHAVEVPAVPPTGLPAPVPPSSLPPKP
jgi:outer membrane protein TolC